jgi:hypothetical protein
MGVERLCATHADMALATVRASRGGASLRRTDVAVRPSRPAAAAVGPVEAAL